MKKEADPVWDAAVIGGGASGILAALFAAKKGKRVLLIERNPRTGRKLLSTGNGRCNFLNMVFTQESIRSDSPETVKKVISQFPADDILSFFEETGIHAVIKNGYCYPYTRMAKDVCDCLYMELKRYGVSLETDTKVKKIKKEDCCFEIYAESKTGEIRFCASSCVIATGGLAFPKSGSDGFGYEAAKSFGHRIKACVPALCELYCSEDFFKELKGIRLPGRIRLFVEKEAVAEDGGEIQLTGKGISGIPVFNVSRYAAKALNNQKYTEASMDFWPDEDYEDAFLSFRAALCDFGWGKSVLEALRGRLHPSLLGVILERAGIARTLDASGMDKRLIKKLLCAIKDFHVVITGSGGYEKAQTTAGGVALDEVDPFTLESRLVKGLFFCGEVLDADGMCGGYNLQWAWASGYVCGCSV